MNEIGKFSRVVYFHQPIAGDLKDTQICDLSSLFSIGSVVMSEGSQIYFPAYPFHIWIPLILRHELDDLKLIADTLHVPNACIKVSMQGSATRQNSNLSIMALHPYFRLYSIK
ncbi:hypothetical protein CDL12_01308 [Handroanthus impetiginosus]|uniref:Uncharacterized protein n=1 Tax=Handroanthus impetiginosus TaxID=429701 RepID=A0A2G9I859_9LAMI|nr:hypothetical protein CDL12_01308 [Handroanthus impetiginosus]